YPSDNRATINPALIQQQRIGTAAVVGARRTKRLRTTGLPLIAKKLALRKPSGHFGIEPVGDGFEIEILPIIQFVTNIEVDRLRVVVAVLDKPICRHLTAEHRNVELVRFLADGDPILLIPK